MRKFRKIIQIIILVFITKFANAIIVPVQWDLTLKYDSLTNVYTVYGKPDTTYTFNGGWTMASAQVTVLLEQSLPDVQLNITSYMFGGWNESDNCYGGSASGGFDYHSITTFGQVRPIFKDSLMRFFSFPSPDTCRNFVRLKRNATETFIFSNGPASAIADDINPCPLQGSDYANYLSNGTAQFTEAYRLNFNNYGWHCGPFPLIPLNTLLKDADARAINCNALITWESATEKDVDGYAVMVSKNGNTFTELTYILAKGSATQYSYEQLNANSGTNYYKIVIKKKDGTMEYSNLMKLTIYCNGDHSASAYPNPSTEYIDFVINTGTQDENTLIKVKMLDMLGNIVSEKSAKIQNNKLRITFNTLPLANGNYMIQYQNNVKSYNGVVKFTKIN